MSARAVVLHVEPEERDAILAGLRLLQAEYDQVLRAGPASRLGMIRAILENGKEGEGLGPNGIDSLCERINLGEPWDNTQAVAEGWFLAWQGDGRASIQKDDESERFAGDDNAHAWVMGRAAEGSDYHQQARAILEEQAAAELSEG